LLAKTLYIFGSGIIEKGVFIFGSALLSNQIHLYIIILKFLEAILAQILPNNAGYKASLFE